MKVINRSIVANGGQNLAAVGTFIWLKSSTGAVQVKTDRGETAVLSSGEWIRADKPFTEFFVTDLSGAQNDLTFNTSENGEAGKYGIVDISTPNILEDVADVAIAATTKTLILAANSNRNEAVITALSANASVARIGSTNTGAARGTPLQPGGTLFLNSTAAVYAYSANIATFAVNWTEFS